MTRPTEVPSGPDISTVDEVLCISGLSNLGQIPPMHAIHAALAELAGLAEGADDLRRESIRAGAVRLVREAGIQGSTRLVDAALKQPDAQSREVGGGAALTFPDPLPWPDPVDGTELFHDLVKVFERYLALPEGGAIALALWTLFAHCADAAQVFPNLALTSATKRCGKSTTLALLGQLVPRPLPTSNISAAAVFRTIERYRPTLLIDEADTFLDDKHELRGILNGAHTRAQAFVVRTVGQDYEPRAFSTWCPKVIAKIGKLPDTLADRSINIQLRRKRGTDKVEALRLDRLGHLESILRRCARWSKDNADTLAEMDPHVPSALNDRAADNWRFLLAIADLLGGDVPDAARHTAVILSGEDGAGEGGDVGIRLLADIRTIFEAAESQRLPTGEILMALVDMEQSPWGEWRQGKPLSGIQLARVLEPFGISPSQFKRDDKKVRGYLREQFEDPWERYLPGSPSPQTQSGTPVPSPNSLGFLGLKDGTEAESARGAQDPGKAPPGPKVPGYRTGSPQTPNGISEEEYYEWETWFERRSIQLEGEDLP